jgi:NCAIR mutase (PurE)-related protein
MSERPFDAVRRVLNDISRESPADLGAQTRLDLDRRKRSGAPEIVYGRTKAVAEIIASLETLATANGRAIATRCSEDAILQVVGDLAGRFTVLTRDGSSTIVVAQRDSQPPVTGGRVAIFTAGSSDAPVANEAAIVAEEMGCSVTVIRDTGVAGLHRLVQPLERIVGDGVDAIIVAAGMDGALPSVIAGLVAVPVIGLPTSTGYGYGGNGEAALMSMLQTCAPGLSVVNIDNGVGAGVAAASIANRVAAARDIRDGYRPSYGA